MKYYFRWYDYFTAKKKLVYFFNIQRLILTPLYRRYIFCDYLYDYIFTNNVWRIYRNHLVRLSIYPSVCLPVCPFALLSFCLPLQSTQSISFLLRDIEHSYLTERLLINWIYVMILYQSHLSRFKATGRGSAKSVSGLYLSYEETLDVPTLHKDRLCHFKEKCIIPF